MNKKKPDTKPTKPFFSRFLEEQKLQEISGGRPLTTQKFPSDSDEHGGDE
jgi:hypothetical protein